MVERTERRVSHREVRHMILRCESCKAELTIDVASDPQHDSLAGMKKRLACPVCSAAFDSNLTESIVTFMTWYDYVEKSGKEVYIRIDG